MTYVDDVTEAFLRAAATPACHGQLYNLGGSPPASLTDIAEMTIKAAGPGATYTTRDFPADRAAIDIGSYLADDSAFRTATGWTPKVSLQDGIARSLDWYRTRLAAYL